jgi:aminoglycoside 6'-N-acetyltransferase I
MGFLSNARLPDGSPRCVATRRRICGTQAFSPAGPVFAKQPRQQMVRICYVMTVKVRRAKSTDARELAGLCGLLWPDGHIEEHLREVKQKITTGKSGTLPVAIFVAEDSNGPLAGFIEVGLRSHADGCDTAQPVGYIEGWFVRESWRGSGVGRELMRTAEHWSREHGCIEIASDALIDNQPSQATHAALGFEVVDRCVHFKKRLLGAQEAES